MFDEGTEQRVVSLDAATVVAGRRSEQLEVTYGEVSQGVHLQIAP